MITFKFSGFVFGDTLQQQIFWHFLEAKECPEETAGSSEANRVPKTYLGTAHNALVVELTVFAIDEALTCRTFRWK